VISDLTKIQAIFCTDLETFFSETTIPFHTNALLHMRSIPLICVVTWPMLMMS